MLTGSLTTKSKSTSILQLKSWHNLSDSIVHFFFPERNYIIFLLFENLTKIEWKKILKWHLNDVHIKAHVKHIQKYECLNAWKNFKRETWSIFDTGIYFSSYSNTGGNLNLDILAGSMYTKVSEDIREMSKDSKQNIFKTVLKSLPSKRK